MAPAECCRTLGNVLCFIGEFLENRMFSFHKNTTLSLHKYCKPQTHVSHFTLVMTQLDSTFRYPRRYDFQVNVFIEFNGVLIELQRVLQANSEKTITMGPHSADRNLDKTYINKQRGNHILSCREESASVVSGLWTGTHFHCTTRRFQISSQLLYKPLMQKLPHYPRVVNGIDGSYRFL